MHDIDEQPVLWIFELAKGLIALFLINLVSGIWTVYVIHSKLSASSKLPICLLGFFLLSLLSSQCFDPKTHIIGSCISAVTMAFTSPLQAAACVMRKIANPSEPTSDKEIIFRTALPAALPSIYRPAESAYTQILRGIVYLAIGALSGHMFDEYLLIGDIRLDMLGMLLVFTCANGVFNLTSAILALAGFPSPSPFRNPALSPSLTQFWAGRWNAPVSDALRVSLYDPLRKIRGWPKPAACMACFCASGVAHELVLLFCGVHNSRGGWFCFFILSGVSTILEKKIHTFMVSPLLRRVFGFMVFFTLFHYFFLPVTLRTGFARAGVRAMETGVILTKRFYATYF